MTREGAVLSSKQMASKQMAWKPMPCSFGVAAVAHKPVTRSRWCGRVAEPSPPRRRGFVLACSIDPQWERSDEA